MNSFISKNKRQLIILILSVIHMALTFISDRHIFTARASVNPSDYYICKIILIPVLYSFYSGLYTLIFDRNRKNTELYGIVKCALPYLIVILAVAAIKLRGGYLSNDEALIYQNAISLTHYTWFYYITTYYYIVSLMLIPHMYGPIFVKLIIEFLIAGYVVYRISSLLGKKYGYFSYILFLLYPVIAYTTSAHRLPIYFLVYLYLAVKLLFDRIEKKHISKCKVVWLLFVGSILTQWRTEGIYLSVIIPVLMLFAYSQLRNRKSIITLFILTVLIQYVVSVPQNGFVADDLGAAADDRMKPFYAYTITNMFRNGLDLEKNAEDIAIIDEYLSVDAINAINDYYKDINYEDVLILYKEGFIGVREEADVTEFANYASACKRIFINNPKVLLKTRWGAFKYAALPYKVTFTGFGIKQLVSCAVSVVKTIMYNLFIPVIIIIMLWLYSLLRKQWYSFFFFSGLIAHAFIVFILAPASYFKYYFPIYIMAYLYVMLIVMQVFYNKHNDGIIDFISSKKTDASIGGE